MSIANAGNVPANITWTTANQARYFPMAVPWAYTVRRVWWANGTTGGSNVDFGIYSPDGSKIYSTGSTAQSGTSVLQFVTPTAFVLPAGDYYFALNSSGTTGVFFGTAGTAVNQRLCGILQQAVGAVTLPSPATFAAASVVGIGYCGITWTPSGF